ncbi:MAG: RNA degradosome polyphosphate kinase, partial [Lysobacteraceae bacterium]
MSAQPKTPEKPSRLPKRRHASTTATVPIAPTDGAKHVHGNRHPSLYLNRELSQIAFNERVLAQAQDRSVPLLERLRYLCISCTNLDEFFEVRVAAVTHQLTFGGATGPDGIGPITALKLIHDRAAGLVRRQYEHWNNVLRPELTAAGIRVLSRDAWNKRQRHWLRKYFRDDIMPVLSPLGLDPSHPFPRILNKSLNIVVVLEGRDAFGREGHMAIVRAPRSLPRIIRLPEDVSGGENDFVLLSSVLAAFVDELFPGMEVKGAYQFRVTRNSELLVDEDEIE